MKKHTSFRPILVLGVLVAAVLAAGYVVVAMQGAARARYLAQRHERAVATLATQVQSVIDAQVSAFAQAVRRAERLRGGEKPWDDELRAALALASIVLERDVPCRLSFSHGGYRAGFCPTPGFALQTEDAGGSSAAGAARRGPVHAAPLLHFCVTVGTDQPAEFCAYADVGRLLHAYAASMPLTDADVALFDAGERVSFATGPRGPRLVRWPSGALDEASSEPPAGAPPSSEATKHRAWPPFSLVQAAGRTVAVDVDGESHWLVTRPVRVSLAPPAELLRILATHQPARWYPPPSSGRAETWVVAALVPASVVTKQSGSVSSWVLATTGFVLLLGLAVPPLLKLWTLGPRERLRPLDVQFLAASVVGMVGILVIGFLSLGTHAAMRADGDAEIAARAADVRAEFLAWLARGFDDLEAFVEARAAEPPPRDRYVECSHVASEKPSCRLVKPECAKDVSRCAESTHEDSDWRGWDALRDALRDPGFDLALVVVSDQDGNQVEKWSKGLVTEQINMSSFRSFRDVVPASGEPENMRWLPGCGEFAFNIQESPNTAQTLALLSIKGRRAGTAAVGVLDMGALDLRGGGSDTSAIIKRDGQVFLHGNEKRQIFENLLAECSDCEHLVAAIAAGVPGRFDVEYHGRARRAAMEPIGSTGYFALVLRDKERLRTITFETFALATGTYLGILLVLSVAVSSFAGLRDRRAAAWIWPRRRDSGAHADMVVALLLLSLLSVHALGVLEPLPALVATTAAALTGVTTCFLRVRSATGRQLLCAIVSLAVSGVVLMCSAPAGGGTLWWRIVVVAAVVQGLGWLPLRWSTGGSGPLERRFLTAALLLVLLTAVLPAVAAFRDAFTSGAGRLAANETATAASPGTRLAEQATCHEEAVLEGAPPAGDLPGRVDDLARRVTSAADGLVRTARSWVSPATSAPGPRWPLLSASMLPWLPFVNDEATALRLVRPSDRQTSLASTVPELGSVLLLVVVALATLSAWLLIRGIARRIFGIHLTEELPYVRASEERALGVLWLDPSAAEVAHAWTRYARSARVDLRSFPTVDDLRRQIGWAVSAPSVLVLHLEHRIDEPAWNTAKLELLEAILFTGPRKSDLLVLSEIDLLAYMTERVRSPGDPANDENYLSAAELDRWSSVLNALAKRPSTTRPGGPALSWDMCVRLAAECHWTSRLQGIEREIHDAPLRGDIDAEGLIRDLGDRAAAHYRMLWSACTDEERLVLLHLARDGFVSPKSWPVVRRLFGRRLVRWTPALRLMNESFRRFVATVEDERVIRRWEQAGGLSSWRKLQVALVLTFVVVGFFLYATRPDQLTGMVAFLTAIGGGAATLVQLMGFLRTRAEAATER